MTSFPQRYFLSDAVRCPDWPTIIAKARPTACILRDYDTPDRPGLAEAMRDLCRRFGVSFAVAGDAKLAARLKVGFHCPSYQLARPALRCGAVPDSAAVHNRRELLLAQRAGCRSVLLSPIFATASHPSATPLGVIRAQGLARQALALQLTPIALGGMSAAKMARLDPSCAVFAGFAAISAFAATDRAAG